MNLFQTKELVKARLEEREKYQREILREKEEAQQKHQQRLDDLRRSELQLKERYCKREQVMQASSLCKLLQLGISLSVSIIKNVSFL